LLDANVRSKLVPGRIKEHEFWRRFLWRLRKGLIFPNGLPPPRSQPDVLLQSCANLMIVNDLLLLLLLPRLLVPLLLFIANSLPDKRWRKSQFDSCRSATFSTHIVLNCPFFDL
jgi:hypothetical protein